MEDEEWGIIINIKLGFWTCNQGNERHYKGEGKG
jgi:hypothetical protein